MGKTQEKTVDPWTTVRTAGTIDAVKENSHKKSFPCLAFEKIVYDYQIRDILFENRITILYITNKTRVCVC